MTATPSPSPPPSDEDFTRAFVALLRRQHRRDEPRADLLARIDDTTPPDAAALVRALAEHDPSYVTLGWRRLDDEHGTLDAILEVFGIAADQAPWLDGARSVILGASGGGEITFGAHWSRGRLEFVTIDGEWRYYRDIVPVTDHGGSAAFWTALLADEQDRADRNREDDEDGEEGAVGDVEPALRAVFAEAGAPLPEPPEPGTAG
jgi:hypothetical protein